MNKKKVLKLISNKHINLLTCLQMIPPELKGKTITIKLIAEICEINRTTAQHIFYQGIDYKFWKWCDGHAKIIGKWSFFSKKETFIEIKRDIYYKVFKYYIQKRQKETGSEWVYMIESHLNKLAGISNSFKLKILNEMVERKMIQVMTLNGKNGRYHVYKIADQN